MYSYRDAFNEKYGIVGVGKVVVMLLSIYVAQYGQGMLASDLYQNMEGYRINRGQYMVHYIINDPVPFDYILQFFEPTKLNLYVSGQVRSGACHVISL